MTKPCGRVPIYGEPLNERITTEFTKAMRKSIREKCIGKSEAEYIRELVCKDLGMELKKLLL